MSEDPELKPEETATEVMIRTMEDFNRSEPKDILIIYSTEHETLAYRSNIESSATLVGMMQCLSHLLLSDLKRMQT